MQSWRKESILRWCTEDMACPQMCFFSDLISILLAPTTTDQSRNTCMTWYILTLYRGHPRRWWTLKLPDHEIRARICRLLRSHGIDSQPGGQVRQAYLTNRPARLHRLAESIPWNRFLGFEVTIVSLIKIKLQWHSNPSTLHVQLHQCH